MFLKKMLSIFIVLCLLFPLCDYTVQAAAETDEDGISADNQETDETKPTEGVEAVSDDCRMEDCAAAGSEEQGILDNDIEDYNETEIEEINEVPETVFTDIDDNNINEATGDEQDLDGNTAERLQNYGIPVINLELQGTDIETINRGLKTTKYPGNRLSVFDPNEPSFSLTAENVEIKGRGNSTWNLYGKKPYQIKFDKKTSLFGFPKAKKYLLLANAADPSLVKNAIIADLATAIGYRTYRYQYVDLYADGCYLGNYLLTQKIEISDAMLDLHNDKGILAEIDQYAEEEENYFVSKLTGAEVALKDSVLDENSETVRDAFNSFKSAYLELEKAAVKRDWAKVRSLCDTESFVKYYLLSELAANGDASVSSFYLYKDGDDDVIHAGPVWDFDHGFGHRAYPSAEYLYVKNDIRNDAIHTSLLSCLMEIPEFRESVSSIWQASLNEAVKEEINALNGRMQELAASAQANQKENNTIDFKNALMELQNWLLRRQSYLNLFFSLSQGPEEGLYKIYSASTEKILGSLNGSIGNRVLITQQTELYANTQLVELHKSDDGAYEIRNVISGKYYEIADHDSSAGTVLRQNRYDATYGQKWKLINAGGGAYYLMSSESGQVLAISDSYVNIETKNFEGIQNEKFIVKPASFATSEKIEEGVYFITSRDPSKGMGVINSGKSLKLCDLNNPDSQLFEITSDGKGFYKIKNVKTGMYLDCGNYYSDGCDITLGSYVSLKNQQWGIKKNGDGSFTIYSALNGRVADIEKGVFKNGTNIRCYRPNGTAAQKWDLLPVDITPIREGNDGEYEIVSFKNAKYGLDIAKGSTVKGGNLQLYPVNNTEAQSFSITLERDGYYTIKNKNSGLVLDVAGGSLLKRANVRQWLPNGTDAQRWRLIKNINSSVIIVNKKSGMVLDIAKGSIAKKTNIQQYPYNRTSAQLWTIK